MVNIAVAGGTGKVGKTILEVLKSQIRHKPFLLTRKVSFAFQTSSSHFRPNLLTALNNRMR